MEDWSKFDCLVFHHVSGLIMKHITRFEGYHRGVVEDAVLLGCDALGIEGAAYFETSEGHSPEDATSHRKRHEP